MAKKVLIVEDELAVQKMYQRFFEFEHYEVRTVDTGSEAMATIRSFMPDLVALDIMLPGVDGIQILREIKADPALQHIVVVMLTNLGEELYEEECLKIGAVAYMIKMNFTPSEVVETISKYLEPDTDAVQQ